MLRWFHNLKVAQKLALISIIFMVPDSVMLYLFITSINENIDVARLEQAGNAYQRPLERLLDLVPQHRLLAPREAGAGTTDAMLRTQEQIEKAFDGLQEVDARLGPSLDFTPEGLDKRKRHGCDAASVRDRWNALKSDMGHITLAASEQRHLQLIADLRAMIAHAGDTSNLILDPELDSYYLMDATLMALPQTQDRLSQVMVDGEELLSARGDAIDRGKTTLAIDLTLLRKDDLDRIVSSTQTALNNGNPLYGSSDSFHARVPDLLNGYVATARRFNYLTAGLQQGGPGSVNPKEYRSAGEAARDASFKLWFAADEELDNLLQNRINYYAHRRTRSLGVAASALLAAILFVTFITRSISGPLKRQAAQLKSANDALSLARAKLEARVVTSTAQLQRTEDKYRSIFENSVMGIYQITPDGRYLSANRAMARLHGYDSPEELMAAVTHVHRDLYVDAAWRKQFIDSIAERGSVIDFESEVRRKDGSIRWVSENARAVRDASGSLLYYEGTVKDVTQRKRAEAEEDWARLQAKAARLAAEAARAAAESANTAKSDFLATMSHEIRTPLNGVIGMTDLLSNTPLSTQQARYTKVIKSSSDALLTLINQILDFSKIEAGKLELDEQNFDLHYAVEEVVTVLAQKAATKGLELACKIDPSVPAHVRGDGDRLRQVLMNILNNAIKFTAQGEVVVRVSTVDAPQPPTGGAPASPLRLRLSVSDTGIGIPTERLNRLFKSFSQVDASTTRRFGGTGLGLAISKQLVELMGGTIGVESVAGKGSTFWFTVALRRQQETASPERSFGLRGQRVLVVDDSQTQCQLLQEQLGTWGVDAAYVTSGAAAMEHLNAAVDRGQPFGTAIVDLSMPGMDGLALARAVRASASLQSLPLILMSGLDAAVDAEANGFVRFLTKPIRQSHLFDAIMKALIGPSAAPQSAPVASPAVPSALASGAVVTRQSSGATPKKSTRILLAEDMEVNQFVVTETLAREGYACDIANTGREAVEAVSRKAYDVVLMDCQMPEMSGFEAAGAIRASERQRGDGMRVPIIALTANAVKGDRERCLAAGMDDYLTKPLNPTKLIRMIEAHAARSTAAASTPATAPESHEVAAGDPNVATAPASAPVEPCVNHAELLARCDGDAAMLGRLVNKFQEKSRQMWDQLLAGYRAGDLATTTRLAHAMKGTASNLSAIQVASLASRLEELGRAGELAQAESVVQQLGVELERCQEAFRGLCPEGAQVIEPSQRNA